MELFSHYKTRKNFIKTLFKALYRPHRLISRALPTKIRSLMRRQDVSIVILAFIILSLLLTPSVVREYIFAEEYTVETLDEPVYEYQTTNIFPGIIESTGWARTDNLYEQNLLEDAWFNDFSEANATYPEIIPDVIPVDEVQVPTQDVPTVETPTPEGTSTIPNTPVEISPTEDTEAEQQTQNVDNVEHEASSSESPPQEVPSASIVEEPTPEPEPPPGPEPASEEPISFGVFRMVRDMYRFATAVFTDENGSSTEEESVSSTEEPVTEELTIEEPPVHVESTVTTSTPEVIPEVVPQDEATSSEAVVATTSSPIESQATATSSDNNASTTFSHDVDQQPASVSCETGGCVTRILELSDFSVGEGFDDQQITNMQLRLSLGIHPNAEHVGNQGMLRIEYQHYDYWIDGGAIPLNEETSNAINGGYQLFAFPLYSEWDEMKRIKVRISYEGPEQNPADVFIDSVWLEVQSIHNDYFNDPPYDPGENTADALLRREVPEGYAFDFLTQKKEFDRDELPEFSFRLEHTEERGVLARIGDGIRTFIGVRDGEDQALSVRVANTELQKMARIVHKENGEYTVRFQKQRQFRPGRYVVTLEVEEDGELYYIDTEFLWGVLAMNVDKTIYAPQEEAYIQMGVLDEVGHTICDADLELRISGPDGRYHTLTTDNGLIAYGEECAGDTFTTTPDYAAYYAVGEVGVYNLSLTAQTANGTHTITDSFEVRATVPFDVERAGPTRIYPPEPYPVTLTITAQRDYVGSIVELVPVSFQVYNSPDAEIEFRTHDVGEARQLIWDVSLDEGETITLEYLFDAPDISPEFYLLGPLKIGAFSELREWQIASDAPDIAVIVQAVMGTPVSATSYSATFGSAPTSGNTIIMVATTRDNPVTLNTPAFLTSAVVSNATVEADIGIWYGSADPATSTYSITKTGGNQTGVVYLMEVSGLDTADLLDVATANDQTGSNSLTAYTGATGVSAQYGFAVAGTIFADNDFTAPTSASWSSDSSNAYTQQSTVNWATGNDGTFSVATAHINAAATQGATQVLSGGGTEQRNSAIAVFNLTPQVVTAGSAGNQIATTTIGTADVHVGGAFALTMNSGSTNVTRITISEQGTVDAQNDLSNIELYYESDTTAPYNCVSESYAGTEAQFGSASSSFSGANGTADFVDSVSVATTSTLCIYPVMTIDNSASHMDTVEVQINNASTDVTVSAGSASPASAVLISDTTLLLVAGIPDPPILVENPALDNLHATTTPVLGSFSASDPDSDDVEFQIQIDDDYDFSSPVFTRQSSDYPTDAGWESATYASSDGGAWYNTSWPYRIPITIQASLVDEELIDFPVYVDLSTLGSQFFSDLTASGGDIRVTTSDGVTELPREVFGVSVGTEVGELYFEADSISDVSNTRFYIYYGNSGASDYSASDTYGSQNVWANNYEVVYHLEEDPSTGAPQYVDSTGNSSGTSVNMEGADQISGIAGSGASVDGVDESIQTNANTSILASTWSIWLNANGTQGACDGAMFSRGTGVNGMNVGACGNAGLIGYHWENLGGTAWNWTGGPTYPTNQWFMATLRIEPSQATAFAFAQSGVTSGSNVNTHATSTIDNLDFGWDAFGTARSFNGSMDEARLSSVARSQNWLQAEYYNIASTTDFYASSSRQTETNSSATYTIQPADALTDGETYFWRVRARDPGGANEWSEYSEIWSLTIDDLLTAQGWHQTLGLQFDTDTLSNITTTTDGAELTTLKTSATTTDSFESVGDGSTNFASTNIWKQASITTDAGDWQGETGATGSGGTGPDEASDGTVFIYTEASNNQECDNTPEGDDCVIEADIADGTLNGVQFDYHMFGGSIGTLSLDLYDGSVWTTVWSRTGQQSTDELDWQDSGYLDLSIHQATTTALRFYANGNGAGFDGDFALDNIRIATSSGGLGTIMSTEVDFDWISDQTDWGAVSWNVTEPAGSDTRLRLYYTNSAACDTLVPDGVLPGNSTGFISSESGFFINDLSTSTYNRLCLEMTFDQGTATSSPILNDWTLSWTIPQQPPGAPLLAETPAFENQRSTTTTPVLGGFSASDYEGDLMQFQIVVDDDYDFSSPVVTATSSDYPTDAGWTASNFASDATTTYHLQQTLTTGETYWWRVRARDPFGTNTWSEFSEARSITINSSISIPQWYQTTDEQFEQGTLLSLATSTDALSIQDATTTAILNTWTTGNTKTISAGTDRLLLVVVTSEDSGTNVNVNSVTYGGQTLTQVEEQQAGTGFSNGIWMGYLTEAGIQNAVGTTITPTWTGGTPDNFIQYASIVLENVDQAAPVRGSSSNFNDSGNTIQIPDPLQTEPGDYTLYATIIGQQNSNHTPDTGYTEVTQDNTGGNGQVTATAYKYATASQIEQPTATWDATFRMGMAAAVIRPGTATGTIMSREVDFDWVEGQDDWGEVVWNTTEPAGSGSLLQVYYTNSAACDTLVPDGVLPGNSTGFSAGQSPLNISGLSTSTYNQICLRMELQKISTSTSPTLDDWAVSWELNPVYTQNYYRWYTNTNAQTPTDPWPAGSEIDLAENAVINAASSVAYGDVLRLRMSVIASSTAASAGSESFILQYAESQGTCTASLSWFEVGAIGSTTAKWRGYNNSTVSDGSTLSSTTLSVTDVAETYEEENTTAVIPNTINNGDNAEWDFVIESNADADTIYCFRMARTDGSGLNGYINYPRLITNEAPVITLDAPFDNEKLASTSPWFDFVGVDGEGEDVHYQIQIDNDADFTSPVIDTNTEVNLTDFNNLITPADKAPYIHNQMIRYIIPSSLANGVTYWWRVRAKDPDGSNVYGDWATAYSFTIDTSVTIETWFQTTTEQFETNSHIGTEPTSGAVSFASGSTTGTTTSTAIDFTEATIGNAWGSFSFTETGAANNILYHIEYYTGSSWELIPDTDLSGNTAGYDTSPVNLIDLDTETYNLLRIRANFNSGTPSIQDWTVEWGERVSVPTLLTLFDNEKVATTAPAFTFYSTDPDDNDLAYEFSWSTDYTFQTGSTTVLSSSSPGFSNITTGLGDSSPFNSGDTIQYFMQSPLTPSTTYWWRVRAHDPSPGGNGSSFWSEPYSFTLDGTVDVSTWFQTTEEQFDTNTLSGVVASTSDSVTIPASVSVGILDAWTTGNTKTVSNGSNRLLVVAVYSEDSGSSVDVNSVTYGGQLMTQIADQQMISGFGNGVWVGYLNDVGIDAASNTTINVNWLGGDPDNFIQYASVVLENVDQSNPVSAWSGSTNTGGTTFTPTTTVAYNAGDMVAYAVVSGQQNLNHTPSTGFTEGTEENSGGNGMVSANAYVVGTTTGTLLPTATWSGSVNRHAMIAFTVERATAITSGVMTSSAIDFDDGSGPAWEQIYWTDSTPGASAIAYQVEYLTGVGAWQLIPDAQIAGNSSGITSSPINIKPLNTSTYNEIRLVANFTCAGGNCPTLDDWTVEWSEGIDISGTAYQYDLTSSTTSGTLAVAVNGVLQVGKSGSIQPDGTWQIDNVTIFPGDVVTVFMNTGTAADQAVAVSKYDGIPEMTGLRLYQQHLSIGSDDAQTITNADIGQYENSDNVSIFYDVNGSNQLTVCASTGCSENGVVILSGNTYQPGANATMHDIHINGTFVPGSNTMRVSGSWDNNNVFTAGASTIIFTATSTTETIDSTGASTASFNNFTLGETSGTATWQLSSAFDVNGNMTISRGTLNQNGANAITYAGNLTIGTNGLFTKGTATTTFDGTGSRTWTDNTVSKQDLGTVVIDGTTKTVQLGSNVAVTDLTIGADDIFTVTGSNFDITVYGSWTNNNVFTAQQGEVIFAGTSAEIITAGSSAFYDLTFNGVGGSWSFTNSTLTVNNDFRISTGTVTMTTATTTIAGSFLNTGGTFAHNNSGIRFTSNGPESISANGTAFSNAFYNLHFTGAGTWTFTDTNASTSNDVLKTNGALVLPAGYLTVGGSFLNTGGTLSANNGTLRMIGTVAETISLNNQSLYSFQGGGIGTYTFLDTNVTMLGHLTILAGTTVLPSGVLTLGGSLTNNSVLTANNGQITFNSTDAGETINTGNSSLYNVLFNSATGGWTITNHATATQDFTLTNAGNFALGSGQVLSVGNVFTNSVGGASTTWADSTLILENGAYSINGKTDQGDAYGTLHVRNTADIAMWNSTSTVYTVESGGSLYSQDHNDANGDLYIFGDYARSSGTEHWSYATDFDGTSLSGSERQARVYMEDGATVMLTDTSRFSVVGASTATTTIQNQGVGTYTVAMSGATTTMNYYDFDDLGATGLSLSGTGAVTSLSFGAFTPAIGGGTALTLSSTTIDANPAKQIFNVEFGTTTAISASNVTQSDGTPTSFWWFRQSYGNLDGEAFDADTGDPGSVRWDDSSLQITVAGTVYADDGVTPLVGGTCDGVSTPVRVVVNGGATYDGSCSNVDGTFSIPSVAITGDPTLTVYLNDASGGERAVTVTKTPTANITDLDLYADRVITRHEDVNAMTIADMQYFDNGDDTDIPFTVATGTTNVLTVLPDTELYIWATTTFTPGGTVTLESGGAGNTYDGSLHIANGATFTGSGTSTYSIGGIMRQGVGATFIPASTTVSMTATTSGKAITAAAGESIAFFELEFIGVNGAWNINSDIDVAADVLVATGTVTGTGNITLTNGSFYGNGLVSLGGGLTTLERTNTLGGTTPWTFYNLTLGNGVVTGTTTPASTATTTVSGVLTIAVGHFLDAGSMTLNLAGTGSVFIENGTFLEDTSAVVYSGSGAANILSTTYYDLRANAQGGSPTYTATGLGVLVLNDFVVGTGGTTTVNFNTNDTTLEVDGDMQIGTRGIFIASDTGTFTISGSYDNDGTFTGSGGLLRFDGTGTHMIAAGGSSFSSVRVDGTGSFTVSEHATATGVWRLQNATSFTLSPSQTLAVGGTFNNYIGGAATTWTNSVLSLYGGNNYTVNPATTTDTYGTLQVGANTQVRLWNSDAASTLVNASGSLYSQDHGNQNGDLYIYGQYIKTTGTDYWSYATDFDGTSLTGSERQVDVYIAGGSSITYRSGGTLQSLGAAGASTTIQNQGSGQYGFIVGSGGTANMDRYVVRDTNSSGFVFTGAPTVTTLSRGDFLVTQNGASAITVGGTAITANPAKTFTNNVFATSSGISAFNVTATGTTFSSWRFTNHTGSVAGEAFDVDPDGDPGYVVWDDSAASITVSGRVYSDEGSTVSAVCDGSTNNIHVRVAGLTSYPTNCAAGTGLYSVSGVTYSPGDTITVYIDGETERAATVTVDPVSNINDMDLYENRVIVRHQDTDPITISDMAVWDSSDDADIPFTAVDAGTDTLTLPSNRKLLVWTNKEFEPGGNVTVTGGGAGALYDGTLEVYTGGTLTFQNDESHTIGGSFVFGSGAVFTAGNSTTTFTTTGAARTIDVNTASFGNVVFNGSGSWNVTDATLDVANLFIASGAVTLPAGTTTISLALNVTGGSFAANNGTIIFDSVNNNRIVRTNGSDFATVQFTGTGSWNMTDTNATATAGVTQTGGGTVTLPSGVFTIGDDFRNASGTLIHNNGTLRLTSGTSATLLARNSDLSSVIFDGAGTFAMEDSSLTLLDTLIVTQGSVTFATGTLSIGGSFDASGGTFDHASGTVLFNSSDTGETINPGTSSFYNAVFGSGSGGWTISSHATTTNNFTLSSAASFTLQSGQVLSVEGVFSNLVGGSGTTWSGSTLRLLSGTSYALNTKSTGGDQYETLYVGDDTDINTWNSRATTTTVISSGSLYSKDHGAADGALNIYGDYHIGTTTEYWSYDTDFDGTALGGGSRAVVVSIAANATTTVDGGTLHIVGGLGNETIITNQGSGQYAFTVSAGTFNAQYYAYRNLDTNGLMLSGTPTISSLNNGDFELAVSGGTLISLSSTTLNANASLVTSGARFATTTAITGYNVTLTGSTSNAWTFVAHTGNLDGEAFDVDGADACGQIRWSDSSCLLTQQTHYRWRNDDGSVGVPSDEWYHASWTARKRVRIENADATEYTDAAVKLIVTYDSDMQSDFSDLRFTDDSGTTTVPHWLASTTASAFAEVWVKVPTLPSSETATVFMYYKNATASSTSSSTDVFIAADDFEDDDIAEYSGDTSLFNVGTAFNYDGTYGLDNNGNEGARATDGIFRFDQTVSQGETIRYLQYVDTSAGSGDEVCTLFGVQSPGTTNQNYAVCLEQFGVDRVSLVRDADDNDSSGVLIASSTIAYTSGWYEIEIEWGTDDSFVVDVIRDGAIVVTLNGSDSTYTSGGIGFTYWFHNGGWDSYASRPTLTTEPTVYYGAEQTDGGATWAAALDTAASGITTGSNARLRIAVENSGLSIVDQNFDIEYAAKGGAPSCEAVSAASYVTVPNQASCGSSPICMQTSTFVTNNESTTDLLFGPSGEYTLGQAIESPSNTTNNIDLAQDTYTEVEYVLTPTVNVSDSNYCFRVTDGGSDLDTYLRVAELELRFDPTFGPVSFNLGADIALTPGTTTRVYATSTVSDLNGYADLVSGTSTMFTTTAGAACSANDNNCYISTGSSSCSFSNCAGNSCELSCYADIYYHADPTDADGGEEWFAFLEAVDQSGGSDFATSPGIELLTLRALSVDAAINYGALEVNNNTGSFNPTTTIENIGNDAIDVEIEGTNLSDGVSSEIPSTYQRASTTSFTYAACAQCVAVPTTTPIALEVDLGKPTTISPPTVDDVYWGIAIPTGVSSNPYQGINTFYAISDN